MRFVDRRDRYRLLDERVDREVRRRILVVEVAEHAAGEDELARGGGLDSESLATRDREPRLMLSPDAFSNSVPRETVVRGAMPTSLGMPYPPWRRTLRLDASSRCSCLFVDRGRHELIEGH